MGETHPHGVVAAEVEGEAQNPRILFCESTIMAAWRAQWRTCTSLARAFSARASPPETNIVIVGGGASAAAVVVNLLRDARTQFERDRSGHHIATTFDTKITVVERERARRRWTGAAWSTTAAWHKMNVPCPSKCETLPDYNESAVAQLGPDAHCAQCSTIPRQATTWTSCPRRATS